MLNLSYQSIQQYSRNLNRFISPIRLLEAGAVVKLGPGDFFGELGLVRGLRSPLIIQTISNCEVWMFHRCAYLSLLEHLPQCAKQQILVNYLDILKV